MDVSNVRSIFKEIGQKEFWNANSLNSYFTKLTTKGLSSITVYSKLRSLRRFIDYLKLAIPSQLPSSKLVVVNSMLSGIEKTLLRNRKKDMKKLMSKNRENYQHTISILKRWRKLRVRHNELKHIHEICEDPSHILGMRNMIIFETIL